MQFLSFEGSVRGSSKAFKGSKGTRCLKAFKQIQWGRPPNTTYPPLNQKPTPNLPWTSFDMCVHLLFLSLSLSPLSLSPSLDKCVLALFQRTGSKLHGFCTVAGRWTWPTTNELQQVSIPQIHPKKESSTRTETVRPVVFGTPPTHL